MQWIQLVCKCTVQSHACRKAFIRRVSSSLQEVDTKGDVPLTGKVKPVKPPFAKNLFVGKFDVDILTFPEVLEDDALRNLENTITPLQDYFKNEVDSATIHKSAVIPDKNISDFRTFNLFGLNIPKKYGGLDLTATEYARFNEVIFQDTSVALMVSSHVSLGLKGLMVAGSDKQKEKYLPRLASGEWIAALCLAEPIMRNDVPVTQTTAKLSDDEKTWYLTGKKSWVANGGIADLLTVIAKTKVSEFGGRVSEKLTAFLVEKTFPGVSCSKVDGLDGCRGADLCEVSFERTPIPAENMLGKLGEGFKLTMDIVDSGRYSAGSHCAGVLKNLLEITVDYAINHNHFGKPIMELELVQKKLGEVACLMYTMESMTYLTAGILDNFENPDTLLEGAIVKVFSIESLQKAIKECQNILGNIYLSSINPHHRILEDFIVLSATEGVDSSLREFVALSGLQHAGLMLKDVVEKQRNPFMNPGFILKRLLESRRQYEDNPRLTLGLDGYLHPSLQRPGQQLEYCVLRLQYAVEVILTRQGKNVVEDQINLHRLADIAIIVYGMTAVLARASRAYCTGLRDADSEITVAGIVCLKGFEEVKKIVQNINNSPYVNHDIHYKKIGNEVVKNKGYYFEHPLTRNC